MVIYLPVTFEHCPLVHIILVAVTCPDLKHAAGALVIGSSLAQREKGVILMVMMRNSFSSFRPDPAVPNFKEKEKKESWCFLLF